MPLRVIGLIIFIVAMTGLVALVFSGGRKKPRARRKAHSPAPSPKPAVAPSPSAPSVATKAPVKSPVGADAPDLPLPDPDETLPPGRHILDLSLGTGLDAVADEPAAQRFEEEETGLFPRVLVTAVGRTNPGTERKNNEDSYLVMEDQYLFAVADGMGGHAAGEVASQLAVELIRDAFKAGTFGGTANPSRPRRGDELVRAILSANEAVYREAKKDRARQGMGTTVVSLRFSPAKQRAYIAHVGDSRCYRLRNDSLTLLTRDHTYGALGIQGRNADVLSRAIGLERSVEVDLAIESPQPGDTYLLCTDGLNKMVPDDLMRETLLGGEGIHQACQRLIALANERGGADNITVILVQVREPPLASAQPVAD